MVIKTLFKRGDSCEHILTKRRERGKKRERGREKVEYKNNRMGKKDKFQQERKREVAKARKTSQLTFSRS